MTKSEMYELAKIGARDRAQKLQAEAMELYKEFSSEFAAPPQIGLRLELRNGSSNGLPVITALPGEQQGSKASQVLPYLVHVGPTRQKDLAAALGMKSVGSLSTVLGRHLKAGTIERRSKGLYAATKAGEMAVRDAAEPKLPKTKRKPQHKSGYSEATRERRAESAALLAVLEKESMDSETLAANGHKVTGLGPLVRRGYLARLRSGVYKRTAKPYVVDDRKSAQP